MKDPCLLLYNVVNLVYLKILLLYFLSKQKPFDFQVILNPKIQINKILILQRFVLIHFSLWSIMESYCFLNQTLIAEDKIKNMYQNQFCFLYDSHFLVYFSINLNILILLCFYMYIYLLSYHHHNQILLNQID